MYFQAPPARGFFFLPGSPKPGAKAALLHMNADLTRLIRLQQLETAADDARRKIADHPARTQALDARLQGARDAVAGMKSKLAAASDKRRVEEKEVAGVQTRLAKYKTSCSR
jgi:predicted  nucleic acid-binding Zn-ribbon protein